MNNLIKHADALKAIPDKVHSKIPLNFAPREQGMVSLTQGVLGQEEEELFSPASVERVWEAGKWLELLGCAGS